MRQISWRTNSWELYIEEEEHEVQKISTRHVRIFAIDTMEISNLLYLAQVGSTILYFRIF